MTFIASVVSLQWFWQKWNLISGDKIYVSTIPKWNHTKGNIYACEYCMKTKVVDQKIKAKFNFTSFGLQWKLI